MVQKTLQHLHLL